MLKQLLLLAALFICLAPLTVTSQKAKPSSTAGSFNEMEKLLLSLEAENNRAVIAGDGTSLAKLYAEDYVGISAGGTTSTKADILGFYASDGSVIAVHQTDETKVRVFDKTAVVTARLKYKYNKRMENQSVTWMRYTRIYNLRGKDWVVVAEHFSEIESLNQDDLNKTAQN